MLTSSQILPSAAGILPRKATSHQTPPMAKNNDPLAISLLSAEAPTRFSELSARSGEPRCITEARNPMPITTHRKNMLRTRRCLVASSLAESQHSPLTISAPTTHCPSTVNSTSGHSCHPLPMLHLPRVCQITGGIPGWTAVGVGFNHNVRFGKVCTR